MDRSREEAVGKMRRCESRAEGGGDSDGDERDDDRDDDTEDDTEDEDPESGHKMEDAVMRFVSSLNLDHDVEFICMEIASALEYEPAFGEDATQIRRLMTRGEWNGRPPESVAASIVWIVNMAMSKNGVLMMQDLVEKTGVLECSIIASARAIVQRVKRLLPLLPLECCELAITPSDIARVETFLANWV